MVYEVVNVYISDKLRGIKVGMKCYVRGVRYVEYDGSRVYEVDMIDWVNKRADGSGYYLMNEKQLRLI